MFNKENSVLLGKSVLSIIISYIFGSVSGGFIAQVLLKAAPQNEQNIRHLCISIFIIIFLRLFMKLSIFNKISEPKKSIEIMLAIIFLSLITNHDQLFSNFTFQILVTVIVVGIFEEILFRGIIFVPLTRIFQNQRHGFLWASVVSSLIFAAAHLNNLSGQSLAYTLGIQCVFAFICSMFFSLLYQVSDNILLPIFAHFVIDLIAMSAAQFSVTKVDLATAIEIVIFVICSAIVYLYFLRGEKY
ncbi:CPBP family intramembrane glutamic endopeptidase [Xylocopilactobacillus apicola]|uniref:CAAX prenyl protease 2/Lysostaphin resistance protein A-like domain-containing protein n=1 Tax=Xylocopilactobacillus apicola TaxID=2932184 RepID=A0AAU9DC68_9LACO|nr:CPBP family intramembrane glutamic endopeptidase [Xylocopilactobacillus apicola]BDR59155.1 hypothetical protein XA3_15960 [Xylocopilactobacillus apicola]